MALVAFSDYTQPKDIMPGSISANFAIWHLWVRVDHLCFNRTNYVEHKINGPPGPLMPGPFML